MKIYIILQNFLKAIIYSSNELQSENLHNTSNFLKAIIYSSNELQNENLHNTSNFLKEIINSSNELKVKIYIILQTF